MIISDSLLELASVSDLAQLNADELVVLQFVMTSLIRRNAGPNELSRPFIVRVGNEGILGILIAKGNIDHAREGVENNRL
jgi:hypothetical protein